MFGKLLKRSERGKIVKASTLNQAAAEAERLSKFTVAAPLQMQDGPTGIHLSLAQLGPMWIKITGAPSSGAYPWIQQVEATGGGWTNGNLSSATGSPSAFNSIGVGAPTVPVGTIVLARWSSARDLRFSAATC